MLTALLLAEVFVGLSIIGLVIAIMLHSKVVTLNTESLQYNSMVIERHNDSLLKNHNQWPRVAPAEPNTKNWAYAAENN